jgi:glycosyltransferase involved in cell wall biosynthesis
MKVCAVMAAYNESQTVASVIQRTIKYVDKVFVVDDGSSDGTAEIAQDVGAEVIKHGVNKGPGAAVQTGYEAAFLQDFDYIVQIDADGQHDPEYILKLLETAICENCDVVIGSRFLNNSIKKWPFYRKMGITFFTKLVNILGSMEITDAVSGFKVHRVESLKKLSRNSNRFPALEQILKYTQNGMKIGEVPVEMPIRKNGKSYLSVKRLAIYPFVVLWAMLRVRFFS